jgi:hypothetical protein
LRPIELLHDERGRLRRKLIAAGCSYAEDSLRHSNSQFAMRTEAAALGWCARYCFCSPPSATDHASSGMPGEGESLLIVSASVLHLRLSARVDVARESRRSLLRPLTPDPFTVAIQKKEQPVHDAGKHFP